MFCCRYIKMLALVVVISIMAVPEIFAETMQQSTQLKAGWYSPATKSFHDGTGIDFAYSIKPIPYVAVDTGIGYYRAEKDATDYLSAIPITLSARAILPLQFISIYGGAGVGSYYKMAQVTHVPPPDLRRSTELSAEHSGFSFGYHAKTGIEFASSIGVSLLIEYKHVVVNRGKFEDKHGGDFYYGGFALNF